MGLRGIDRGDYQLKRGHDSPTSYRCQGKTAENMDANGATQFNGKIR